MPDGNFIFSKIVATPSETAWSQAYSAGKLFTVLSLKKEVAEEAEDEEKDLKAIGKGIIDSLEAEFFSLEDKNLESVKQAISTSIAQVPKDLEFSFVSVVLSGNILYAYIANSGKVLIKREGKFGYILEEDGELASASGYLQNEDLIILETQGFSEVVDKETLTSSLDSLPPTDIAENLAPKVHEAKEGTASAIILSYKEETQEEEVVEEEIEKESHFQPEESEYQPAKRHSSALESFRPAAMEIANRIPRNIKLGHSKKIYLTIAVAILAVLVISIFLGIRRQENAKLQAAFDAFYPQAQKDYDEGQSLKDLNQNLATDSFTAAQKLLNDNKDKFPSNSTQEKQINDLLSKVNQELTTNPTPTSLDKSKITISVENGSGVEGAAGKVADYLKSQGYNVSGTSNADNYNYTGVTIKVKDSAKAYLDGLKSDLSKNYTVNSSTSDLPSSSSTDAVVIIGK